MDDLLRASNKLEGSFPMRAKKRGLSLLSAAIMAATAILLSGMTVNAQQTSGAKNIELGAGGISDKDFVYFGRYKNEDIKWKVLNADADNTGANDGIFLLSEYLLEQSNVPFEESADNDNDGQTKPNDWQHSNAQAWCTGFAASAFDTADKTALRSVSKSDKPVKQYTLLWGESSLDKESVFYLSAGEAAKYIGPNWGDEGLAATTSGGAAGSWWLRSPDADFENNAGYVYMKGEVSSQPVTENFGVRPACNLNLGAVLFSSAAKGSKSSAAGGKLTEVAAYSGNEWKITLKDSKNRSGFTATSNSETSKDVGYTDWKIRVSYDNAKTGSNEYVSALLCDKQGDVLYYGVIANNSTSGTAEVTIPTGLATENYLLHIFSEQKNGDYKTDYASAFQTINLTVKKRKLPTPSAGFAANSDSSGILTAVENGMSYSVDGGATWRAVSGTQAEITDVTADHDVKVKRIGDGTTTEDSDIQIIDVTQTAAPSGLAGTACTNKEQNDGKILGVNHTMEYKPASESNWKAVAGTELTGLQNGTYRVRVKADGTALASPAAEVAVGEHTCTAQGEWQSDHDSHWKLCTCGEKVDVTSHSGGTASCKAQAVCGVCGKHYGALNPARHSNLEKTEEKPATHLTEGNITYWHCTGCDKYYSDEAAQNEIPAEATVIPRLKGHTPDGTGWHFDENEHWNTCECGARINKADHTFRWVTDKKTQGGIADAKYKKCTVCGYIHDPNSPQTGDNTNLWLWYALLVASGASIFGTILYSKKRQKQSKSNE